MPSWLHLAAGWTVVVLGVAAVLKLTKPKEPKQ
jgi:hypothetical protein